MLATGDDRVTQNIVPRQRVAYDTQSETHHGHKHSVFSKALGKAWLIAHRYTEMSIQFSQISGKNSSMHKQCVPGVPPHSQNVWGRGYNYEGIV